MQVPGGYAIVVRMKKRGRPTKHAQAMLQPITLRLTSEMMECIESLVESRAREGVDKATIVRELIAKALWSDMGGKTP